MVMFVMSDQQVNRTTKSVSAAVIGKRDSRPGVRSGTPLRSYGFSLAHL